MVRLKFACPVLEINLISAQDLAPISKNMKTYSVAWINTDPMRKLTTRVDQANRANPIWNEKFVFRVDDKILDVDASSIVIEIYAAAWAKDALVGTVNVLLSDLFAPWSGFGDGDDGGGGNNNMRLVTLQIRRPSGRLQGFLRLGVALLDGGQRSMPLSVEVFDGSRRDSKRDDAKMMHRRTNSDQTDLTTSTNDYGVKTGVVTGGGGSGGGGGGGGGGGVDSMVNGSLCSSDIGPSASVVAAAIAQGLYNRQKTTVKAVAGKEDASSILEGKTEGIEHRVERWRAEKSAGRAVEAAGSSDDSSGKGGGGRRQRRRRRRRKEKQRRRNGEGKKGLFSCFGNVFGCEISITCGGGSGGGEGDSTKKKYNNNKVVNLSAVDETFSHSAT
ncbi:hypothetical protein BRARA_E03452 [Brassica rapa]|uniref:C2 domain-containing protein n=1 Tax=Brassica campestris TaxID=3711 RepID=A0A397ZPL9_BRACM|nr:hypothetical protein BRARA_E03452 [Brassica rapa]CAG7878411.1 unnamed protein product [Brassica rapa]VDC73338.1 unnamed protein product [Brassica rapa]